MAKNAIGLAIAAEEYGSKFYANGAAPSGILEQAQNRAQKPQIKKDRAVAL